VQKSALAIILTIIVIASTPFALAQSTSAATYRGIYEAQTIFDFEGYTIIDHRCMISYCTFDLKIANITYPINYRLPGTITNITADISHKNLSIVLDAGSIGSLYIALPREVIDSRAGEKGTGADNDFIVFVNGNTTSPEEYPKEAREWAVVLGIADHPENYRMLQIPVNRHFNIVDIAGTFLIPEFGSLHVIAIFAMTTIGVVIVGRYRWRAHKKAG